MIDQDRDGIIGADDLAGIYNQVGKYTVFLAQSVYLKHGTRVRREADSCMGTTAMSKGYSLHLPLNNRNVSTISDTVLQHTETSNRQNVKSGS